MMKVILFCSIGISIYLLLDIIVTQKILHKAKKYFYEKNEEYYLQLMKYYDKNKKLKIKEKLNIWHKIAILIDRCNFEHNIFLNPISIITLGFLCVYIAFIIAYQFFEMLALSALISLPFFFSPFLVLEWIAERKERKLEKIFLNFLLQLKNHTQIHNDIIIAMKEIKTLDPLNQYVKKFLLEIESGIKFEKAMDNFKEKIKIKQIKMFLTNVQHCYLYGGSYTELIDKSYKIIGEIQQEKIRRTEETRSARMVLFFLILLDILVYISYIKSNAENYAIMQRTILRKRNFVLEFYFYMGISFISNKSKKTGLLKF